MFSVPFFTAFFIRLFFQFFFAFVHENVLFVFYGNVLLSHLRHANYWEHRYKYTTPSNETINMQKKRIANAKQNERREEQDKHNIEKRVKKTIEQTNFNWEVRLFELRERFSINFLSFLFNFSQCLQNLLQLQWINDDTLNISNGPKVFKNDLVCIGFDFIFDLKKQEIKDWNISSEKYRIVLCHILSSWIICPLINEYIAYILPEFLEILFRFDFISICMHRRYSPTFCIRYNCLTNQKN